MKNIKALFATSIYAALLLLAGCEEKNDLINLKSAEFNTLVLDSAYTTAVDSVQKKNILLEDFTGVKCPNCPNAQKEAARIIDLYPERVTVTALHVTDQFATPYPESKFNFRTQDAEKLLGLFGAPPSLPQGAIDRKLFPTTPNAPPSVYVGFFQWNSVVKERLKLSTPVNISFLEKEYDESSRILKTAVKVHYTQAVNEPHYISVNINESGFIDLQLTPSKGVDSFYEQNHVLRAYMQPFNGLKLHDNFQPGNTFIIRFDAQVPPNWNPEKCTVNAFVHKRELNNYEVIHIQETHLK